MPRVLVCTVGGQREPVLNAVRHNQPVSFVYFLGSGGQARGSSARQVENPARERTESRCPQCGKSRVEIHRLGALARQLDLPQRRYAIERVADPDDLEQVLDTCARIHQDIRKRWPHHPPEVIANYTGGTKTMSLGLGLFALHSATEPWDLQLNRVVAGGRTDLVGIRVGDQSVFQDASRSLADVLSSHADLLARRHHHQAAADLLASPLPEARLRTAEQQRLLKQQLHHRLQAARDRLDYGLARQLARQDPELDNALGPWLESLQTTVSALAGDTPWPDLASDGHELVDELRDNAKRQLSRGWPDLALRKLRQAAEALALCRLRRSAGYDEGGTMPRDLLDVLERLAQQGDALGKRSSKEREEVRGLLATESGPLTTHGLSPLSEEIWRPAVERWQQWLDAAQELL